MATSKSTPKVPQDSSKGDLDVSDVATATEFEEKNEVKQHPTLADFAADAMERARVEKDDEMQRARDDAVRMASSQPDFRHDGVVEAVLVDAARKEIDTERTDVARDAAILGDGQFRVRTDCLERVPVQHDADEDSSGRRRRFDVGGQPVFDAELAAKSSANFMAEQEKAAKKG